MMQARLPKPIFFFFFGKKKVIIMKFMFRRDFVCHCSVREGEDESRVEKGPSPVTQVIAQLGKP